LKKKRKGIAIYSGIAKPDSAFAVLGKKTVVIGSTLWVQQAVDLAKGGQKRGSRTRVSLRGRVRRSTLRWPVPANLTSNSTLMGTFQNPQPARAFWGGGVIPASLREQSLPDGKKVTVNSFRLALDMASGLQLELAGDLADAAAATQVVST